MKPIRSLRVIPCWTAVLAILAGMMGFAGRTRAGEDKSSPPPPEIAPGASRFTLSGEFDVSQSYVGSGDVRRNGRSSSLDECNSEVSFVLTPRVPLGYLRLGAEWNRYSFGLAGDGTPLPNTLQSVSLVLGLDVTVSDSILVRIEAKPGLYGTHLSHLDGSQVRVPFLIGGTYIYSPDFQVIAGVSVDVDRHYPVLPGLGVRWKIAPAWVLNAILPAPRLEYAFNRASILYVGAELRGETFRTEARRGTSRLERRLSHALVTFSEVRVGVGATVKILPSLTLSAEGGCQPSREFDFQRADVRYRSDGVAPYGQIMLHGAF